MTAVAPYMAIKAWHSMLFGVFIDVQEIRKGGNREDNQNERESQVNGLRGMRNSFPRIFTTRALVYSGLDRAPRRRKSSYRQVNDPFPRVELGSEPQKPENLGEVSTIPGIRVTSACPYKAFKRVRCLHVDVCMKLIFSIAPGPAHSELKLISRPNYQLDRVSFYHCCCSCCSGRVVVMSSTTNAALLKSKRREQLIATLEALIYNDDVDLDLFQPGAPWPQARDITQQAPNPFQVPSPEERGNVQPGYQNAPVVDTSMGDAADYSEIYADPLQFFDTNHNGVTGKDNSWFSQVHDTGFESSATSVPSHSVPAPPTPPHRHGHDDRTHGLSTSEYPPINTSGHDDFIHYDFSRPMTSPPTSQPPEVTYSSISKQTNNPFVDFMSWDMFMDYGPSPVTSDTKGTNSADDSYDDRQASVSPAPTPRQKAVQPPTPANKRRRQLSAANHRRGSNSPSPPPSSRAAAAAGQPQEKLGQPKGTTVRAHSAIEKRYRAGINEKFEALRGCIESRKSPKEESLGQALGGAGRARPDSKGAEGLGGTTSSSGAGTTPAAKKCPGGAASSGSGDGAAVATRMNKAEVLSEAAEYIQQLEDENGVMLDQLKVLVQRLRATRMALQPMTPISSASSAA